MTHWEIFFFFMFIAFIYSSVGFGGGSSYLAILALYALPFKEIRFIALVCNIIVVTGGTIIFIRKKQVDWKKIIPLVVISVPMAFLGARLKISQTTFFILLGCSLIVAAIMLWIQNNAVQSMEEPEAKPNILRDGLLGGAIGFLSGMVGIGGGIFLSPLLNLMRWDNSKKIAATASIFILVNSIAGIAGQLYAIPSDFDTKRIIILCFAVLIGGQIGSRMGAIKFNLRVVRRVTAVLVFLAGIEVLIRHISFKFY
ncbi:MAG: hypothetical protein C5B52_13610 [Bacteroidetes bacterium]|nr:MAG: hypothetical protein C5B52_13610 [Bacteroidota bacterium]